MKWLIDFSSYGVCHYKSYGLTCDSLGEFSPFLPLATQSTPSTPHHRRTALLSSIWIWWTFILNFDTFRFSPNSHAFRWVSVTDTKPNHYLWIFVFFYSLNQAKNAHISAKLSNASFQLRHITRFDGILRLIDTPRHTVQGFVVNIACDNFLNIFTQVCKCDNTHGGI